MNRINSLKLAINNRDAKALESAIVMREKLRETLHGIGIANIIKEINEIVPEPWQRFLILLVKLSRTEEPAEKFTLCDEMTKAITRNSLKHEGWIWLPLYTCCKYLKQYAIECGLDEHIEACSRTINGALKALMIDPHLSESPAKPLKALIKPPQNKREGYYPIANLLLSIYFRVRAFSLANGVIASTTTQKNSLVPFEEVPVTYQVSWLYYSGVLKFIDQRYDQSLELLQQAFKICPWGKNQQLILFYLIPLEIQLQHRFPSPQFPWRKYPALAELYRPLIKCIKTGDFREYKAILAANYSFLVSKHLYLILLRLTMQVQVHLAHRVWVAQNKQDKLDLQEFISAFETAGQFEGIEPSLYLGSIQLVLSSMIHNNDLMGTIFLSHEKIVLRKADPFPYIKSR